MSAGCAVANRLSAGGEYRVLLLEAGPESRGNPFVSIPLGFLQIMFSRRCNWQFNSEPQRHRHGRSLFQPRGRMLGGSSGMNAQVYIRGNARDYDDWAARGCEGWAYSDVLRYFRQSEHDQPALPPADQVPAVQHLRKTRRQAPNAGRGSVDLSRNRRTQMVAGEGQGDRSRGWQAAFAGQQALSRPFPRLASERPPDQRQLRPA